MRLAGSPNTCVSITRLTDGIREITLVPADGVPLPPHGAGAHVDVRLDGVGTRSSSLIDWPGDEAGR
ncbi:MAG: hypothetical protein Kow0013_28600 [Pararhodobacter sp.]